MGKKNVCASKIERIILCGKDRERRTVAGSVNNLLFVCKGVYCRKQDERMNVVSFFFGGGLVDDKSHYEEG